MEYFLACTFVLLSMLAIATGNKSSHRNRNEQSNMGDGSSKMDVQSAHEMSLENVNIRNMNHRSRSEHLHRGKMLERYRRVVLFNNIKDTKKKLGEANEAKENVKQIGVSSTRNIKRSDSNTISSPTSWIVLIMMGSFHSVMCCIV